MSATFGGLMEKLDKNPNLAAGEKDLLRKGVQTDFARPGVHQVPGYADLFSRLRKAGEGRLKLPIDNLEQILLLLEGKKNDPWLYLVIRVLFPWETIEETMPLTADLVGFLTREVREKGDTFASKWAEILIHYCFKPGPIPFNVWDVAPALLSDDIVTMEVASRFISRHFSVSARLVLKELGTQANDLARKAREAPEGLIERQENPAGMLRSGRRIPLVAEGNRRKGMPSEAWEQAGKDDLPSREWLDYEKALFRYFSRPWEIRNVGDARTKSLRNEIRSRLIGVPGPHFQLEFSLEPGQMERDFLWRLNQIKRGGKDESLHQD